MRQISRSSDDGFSLVEVIVALAILSVLVMAIGGLIQFGSQLQSRTAHEARIELALIDALALRSDLGRWQTSGEQSVAPSSDGFILTKSDADAVKRGITLAIDVENTLTVRSSGADVFSSVDLSVFESAQIEYLSTVGESDWRGASAAGSEAVDAIRLVLTDEDRQWWAVLWIKGSGS